MKAKVRKWNFNYPWDKMWRKKYGIPFGSLQHKEMNFSDMVFDLVEDEWYREIFSPNEKKQELTDEEFENIDLADFE